MARSRLVIVGAGGAGREIYALVEAINDVHPGRWEVAGFVDDGEPDKSLLVRLGVRLLGLVEDVAGLDAVYVIGVGSPQSRRALDIRLDGLGAAAADPLIHPAASIGPAVEFGPGTIVAAGAHATTNVRGGSHLRLDQGVTVGHDTQFGDYVTVAPQCAISGNVRLEDEVELGAAVTVLPQRTVGRGSVVGAGSTVVKDIPEQVVAVGSPAVTHRRL